MKKTRPSPVKKRRLNPFTTIMKSWKLVLIAFMAGGLIGAAVYALIPPPYRAMAVVVMDQNLEAVFPTEPDREIFYFLERETQKLEELAWSDTVIQPVAELSTNFTVTDLRGGILQLSQPSDGGWRMYAIADQPDTARRLANAWADSFLQVMRSGVENARKLGQVQKELASLDLADPGSADRINQLNMEITTLTEASFGIHPEIELFLSQKSDLTVERSVSQGSYIFSGAILGLIICVFTLALVQKSDE
jgi:hypothetical protein